ncbi:MAG: type II toxin-antitoxin system death-on-curing family toxin [Blastocatellia bacterium]
MILLQLAEIKELHKMAIEEFGGLDGIRDEGALESAFNAVLNRLNYEPDLDLAAIAATYAYHLSQAHAFHDGNKRVAAMASETFLDMNGVGLDFTNDEIVDIYLQIASSSLSRDSLEALFRQHIVFLG